MKVKTLIEFKDLKENKMRKVGDEFIVSKARFQEILKAYKEPLVEEVNETKE
jgi:hypothetical protein